MRLTGPWTAVIVLQLIYVLSFIDRTIITMIVGPLKASFGLTEFQIGLLIGPAFSTFYVVCGLPMGWLADRYSRRLLLGAGVGIWGVATAACGWAATYLQLFVGRMGVGVGEAALTPIAHRVIAEEFPKDRLATALAVYTLGAVFGSGLALIFGGALVHAIGQSGPVQLPLLGLVKPWQMVFILIGGVTVLGTPLVLLLPRGGVRPPLSDRPAGPKLMAHLLAHPQLMFGLPLGVGLSQAITLLLYAWTPNFLVTEYGWNIAQAGLAFGVQNIASAGLGTIGSGLLVDRLYRRGMQSAHVTAPLIGLAIAAPMAVIGIYSGHGLAFLASTAVYFALGYPSFSLAAAGLQLRTPPELRGRVAAYLLAVVTILSSTLGPTLPAWLKEHLLDGDMKLALALSIVGFAASATCILFPTIRALERDPPVQTTVRGSADAPHNASTL